MTEPLKAYNPQDDDWTKRDEPIRDPERDQKPGMDVSSLTVESARHASRGCEYCDGTGFATVYDHDYAGSPVIHYVGPDGIPGMRPGRVSAYCECAAGRKIMSIHQNGAKDVHYRTPDFCDIKGKSSFWLESDPTLPKDVPAIPEGMTRGQMCRQLLAGKLKVPHDRAKEARDQLQGDFSE